MIFVQTKKIPDNDFKHHCPEYFTAYRAREGEGKSLPRGEGFRVRVT